MHPNGDILVGILGGMGPAATADFYAKLVRATPARKDQEHLRAVIWSDPTVPDRSAALLENGTDPTPRLIHGAKILARCGANLIAVPCNTAHAFLPAVEQAVDIPIVNMIQATVQALQMAWPLVTRVGLLASNGMLSTGLYDDELRRGRIELLVPRADAQREVMAALNAIKAGNTGPEVQERLSAVASGLVVRGADVLIAGCTEVLLGLSAEMVSVPVIDPAQALAEKIVCISRSELAARTGAAGRQTPS